MKNGQRTKMFLSKVDAKTRGEILTNIAKHYGIDQSAALDEVTDDEAEHLLDYVTGPERAAANVLMQKHGIRGY